MAIGVQDRCQKARLGELAIWRLSEKTAGCLKVDCRSECYVLMEELRSDLMKFLDLGYGISDQFFLLL
jgi:hypothetical protein